MRGTNIALCVLGVMLGFVGVASAIPITSSSDAALVGATVIDFEDQTMGTYGTITIGDITFSGVGGHFRIDDDYQQYNATGIYLDNGTYVNNGFGTLRIDFANTTNAFGFNWGMAESFATWTLYAFNSSDNLIESYNLPSTGPSSAGEFYGLADSGISYAMLSWDGAYDWIAIDNFTYASDVAPVPEPATMFLLGSGLLGLAGFRKKARK